MLQSNYDIGILHNNFEIDKCILDVPRIHLRELQMRSETTLGRVFLPHD
jgi:hypothetical protein